MAEYADPREEVRRIGGKIFFADEADFWADAELRGKWTPKGEPALVDWGLWTFTFPTTQGPSSLWASRPSL